jgi:hypothetical protein
MNEFGTVEVKPSFGERAVDFLTDHPALGWTVYVLGCITVALPLCAVYGNFVGKRAGKAAAKTLLEAGVKL